MKFRITSEEFDKLSDGFKAEYTKDEDKGDYVLKVEGGEDTGALKRAKDHEKKRRQEAEEKLRNVETERDSLKEDYEDLKAKGEGKAGEHEVKVLEKKWQQKLADQKAESDKTISGLKGHIEKDKVDSVAAQMAAELSTSPNLITPHIKARLAAVEVDGEYVTKVKDTDGDIGVMTLDELKNEFKNNNDFAPIIKGSEASGSGAGDEGKGGGPADKSGESKDLSSMSPKDLAAHIKSKKGE